MSIPTQHEQAVATLKAQHEAEKQLANAYSRVFSTKEGKEVLADLLEHFPPDRPRIDALATKASPLASLIGGIHFDGSAAVAKYILDRIETANAKAEAPPTIIGS